MITRVAICISPVIAGRVDEALHQPLDHLGLGRGFFSSTSTAMLAGSSSPSAITAITPTTMKLATTQPCFG